MKPNDAIAKIATDVAMPPVAMDLIHMIAKVSELSWPLIAVSIEICLLRRTSDRAFKHVDLNPIKVRTAALSMQR